jgi:hypothetical protein
VTGHGRTVIATVTRTAVGTSSTLPQAACPRLRGVRLRECPAEDLLRPGGTTNHDKSVTSLATPSLAPYGGRGQLVTSLPIYWSPSWSHGPSHVLHVLVTCWSRRAGPSHVLHVLVRACPWIAGLRYPSRLGSPAGPPRRPAEPASRPAGPPPARVPSVGPRGDRAGSGECGDLPRLPLAGPGPAQTGQPGQAPPTDGRPPPRRRALCAAARLRRRRRRRAGDERGGRVGRVRRRRRGVPPPSPPFAPPPAGRARRVRTAAASVSAPRPGASRP